MFKLKNKKPLKHIPGQIKEALVQEVSAVDYPANGIPFIYVKSTQEDPMDEELRKALIEMGLIPQPVEKADAQQSETAELAPDVMDALTKSAEAFQCVQDLMEADAEGTVDNELEKAGVKKDTQRPAMLQLMASLYGKIGEFLDKAGYDKKKQKMTKAGDSDDGEQPEAEASAEVQKGTEMTEEQIQALVAKSVAEALAKAGTEQPAPEGEPSKEQADGESESPAETEENPLQKTVATLTERFETLTKTLEDSEGQAEELQKKHDQEREALEGQIATLTEGIAALEKKLAVRAPNSALLSPEPAQESKPEPTNIEKQRSTWANTPIADFASEVRSKH